MQRGRYPALVASNTKPIGFLSADSGNNFQTHFSPHSEQFYISIHRKCRRALWLSKRFMGVFSVGEIHCLWRLRKEGSPDFLSRSWQLVRRNAAQFVCQRARQHFRPHPKRKNMPKRCPVCVPKGAPAFPSVSKEKKYAKTLPSLCAKGRPSISVRIQGEKACQNIFSEEGEKNEEER